MKSNSFDWQTSKAPDSGRIVKISDEGCGYWAPLPEGVGLQDAIDAFVATYDYNDYVGTIQCDAEVIVNGEEVQSCQFTLDSR